MKLSDWASIAEIGSGLAVVVTLVFLIAGIQENTEVTRASTYGRSMAGMLEFRQTVVSDPEIARLFNAFLTQDTADLDEVETLRLRQLMWMVYGIFEDAYYARQYGVLGEAEWSRFSYQICNGYPRLASAGFSESLKAVMTSEFADYIEELCVD